MWVFWRREEVAPYLRMMVRPVGDRRNWLVSSFIDGDGSWHWRWSMMVGRCRCVFRCGSDRKSASCAALAGDGQRWHRDRYFEDVPR
jgi:hypothetical protein